MILNLYKNRGETPLECIQRLKAKIEELKESKSFDSAQSKMTYLGRLDPMAEGVLLVASGEDVKKKEEFLGLDKEYDFVAILGFATDSFDVLGKILREEKVESVSEIDLIKLCKVYEGKREQKYPFYSSKMISARKNLKSLSEKKFSGENVWLSPSPRGRPEDFSEEKLFQEESGSEVKNITIYGMDFLGLDRLSDKELFGRLLMDISKVKGDFRQAEILELWREHLNKDGGSRFLARFSAHVSSGTYIRSIVNDIGQTLGIGATTLSIKRTRAGEYKIEDSIKF